MRTYRGGCHCGQIKLTFETGKKPQEFVPRMDQCGFCVRHRAMAIADPSGRMIVSLPADRPEPYRFGLKVTDFHVCDRCGVWVAATWHDGARSFGVINVPALDDRDLFDVIPVAVDFDGEDVTVREDRRRKSWTPAELSTFEA